jgi:caspase domain-containing protein
VEGSQIRQAIIDFFAEATAKDTLLFYFSGHGMPDGHGSYFLASSDIDRKIPQWAGYPFYELEKERERSVAKKVVTILDCCFSGAAGTEISMGDANDIANVARDKIQEAFKEGEGKCLIASSLGDQLSYKMKDHDYSLFTYYLLDGLKGGSGASVNRFGFVTASTLSNYIYDRVTENGRQKPITKTAMSGEIVVAYHPELVKRQEILTKQQEKEIRFAEILRNQKVMEYSKRFMDNVKERMDICFSRLSPKIIISMPICINGYKEMISRGAKIRAITEITNDNIMDCRRLKEMGIELRHLNRVECGIAVSENQYMSATTTILKNIASGNILKDDNNPQLMDDAFYSERKEVVEHNQYVFNTLWNNAMQWMLR